MKMLNSYTVSVQCALKWFPAYLVYQLEACFFGGKLFELTSLLGSQKKLTLFKKSGFVQTILIFIYTLKTVKVVLQAKVF